MSISIISFTDSGYKLGSTLEALLSNETDVSLACKPQQGVDVWTGEQFKAGRNIVFIGACGIAVRLISPFLKDKLSDPAVLVIDEKGKYVIPILSGHVGGANELAHNIAELLCATAVITTATDINNRFAVDLFAEKNRLSIVNKDGIALVSSRVLKDKRITFSIEDSIEVGNVPEFVKLIPYPPDEKADVIISSKVLSCKASLYLKPKEYILGIGCKKGKKSDEIELFINGELEKMNTDVSEIVCLASIDIKKDEKGINDLASKYRIPFITFTGNELRNIEGEFSGSEFVETAVGVDNVCERAAMAACEGKGQLVLRKQARDGVTLAAAKRKVRLKWD